MAKVLSLNLTKTVQAELLPITAVASGLQVISAEMNVAALIAARLYIDFGLDSATTPVGTHLIIQGSEKAVGSDTWRTIWETITGVIAPTAITNDNIQNVGTGDASSPILCGVSVPALQDAMFFKNATLANSEWGQVVARVTTGGSESYTLRDPFTYQQAATTYYNKAEFFTPLIQLDGVKRLRFVVDNAWAASSASCVVRVGMITTDDVGVNV